MRIVGNWCCCENNLPTGSLGVTPGLAGINYLPLSKPMNFLSYSVPLNCWSEGVREQLGGHLPAREGQSTRRVEIISMCLLSHFKTLLPSLCLCPTPGTWKVKQQHRAEAMLSAEFASYQSQAVKKNPATLHLLTLWQILVRLSVVSDYFCKIREIKHFSNPGWLVGWSLVQRSYLLLQWGSGKAGRGL